MPVTTATADPPLEPPGERRMSCGLRIGPNAESSLVVPNANSCRLHLPSSTAPAFRSRCTIGASCADGAVDRTRDAAVVGVPRRSMRSLTEIGTPCSGPRYRPAAISSSTVRAALRAASDVTVMNALSSGSRSEIRARQASTTSVAVTERDSSLGASSPIDSVCNGAVIPNASRVVRRARWLPHPRRRSNPPREWSQSRRPTYPAAERDPEGLAGPHHA